MWCLEYTAKYLLYGINSVVTLVSFIVSVIGVLVLIYSDDIIGDESADAILVPVLIIVSGCVLFFIASFGCCGSIAESPCLLITYSLCMVIILATNVFVIVRVNRPAQVVATIEDSLQKLFNDKETRDTFYLLEGIFKCCGTTGPDSYTDLYLDLPITCCTGLSLDQITDSINNITDSISGISNITDINNSTNVQLCTVEEASGGCTAIIVDLFVSGIDVIYYILVVVVVILAMGILIASGLSITFFKRNKKENGGRDVQVLHNSSIRHRGTNVYID